MYITIPEIIMLIVAAVIGVILIISAFIGDKYDRFGELIIAIIIFIGIVIAVPVLNWYHSSTASGARSYKEYKSEFENGLYREITITAEDGREIFHYEGKIDIETSHENSENYILFESEEGLRYIIYYGVQDTVLIVEKNEP